MNMDAIPIWAVFVGTIVLVLISIEAGYRLGRLSPRKPEEEKEKDSSAVAGTLALAAFIMAFTFGMVTDRYDARRGLVREEANAIRTAYSRSAFLPEPDRAEARGLLRQYLADRLSVTQAGNLEGVKNALSRAEQIQGRLWNMAVVNARKDMNSDVAALYIESINDVMSVHALRVELGVRARVPTSIWSVLWGLTILGLLSLGYQTAIAGSKRSLTTAVMAFCFAIVMTVIVSLDRSGGFIKVSQRPLADLQSAITAGRLNEDTSAPAVPDGQQ